MEKDNVLSFGSATNNAAHVTPLQLLEQAIEDINSGRIDPSQCMILMYQLDDKGERNLHRYCAAMTKDESISMLEISKQLILLEWISDGDS